MATEQVSVEQRERVTIRFAGDSGDGIQLTGAQFTHTSAVAEMILRPSLIFPPRFAHLPVHSLGVSGFQNSLRFFISIHAR